MGQQSSRSKKFTITGAVVVDESQQCVLLKHTPIAETTACKTRNARWRCRFAALPRFHRRRGMYDLCQANGEYNHRQAASNSRASELHVEEQLELDIDIPVCSIKNDIAEELDKDQSSLKNYVEFNDLQVVPVPEVIPKPEEQQKQDVLSNQDFNTPGSSVEDDDKSSKVVSSFKELLELDVYNPVSSTEEENSDDQSFQTNDVEFDDLKDDPASEVIPTPEEQQEQDVLSNQDINTPASLVEDDVKSSDVTISFEELLEVDVQNQVTSTEEKNSDDQSFLTNYVGFGDLHDNPASEVIPTPEEQQEQDVLSNQDINTPASLVEEDDKSSKVVSSFEELLEVDVHNPVSLTEEKNSDGYEDIPAPEEQLKQDVLSNQDINTPANLVEDDNKSSKVVSSFGKLLELDVQNPVSSTEEEISHDQSYLTNCVEFGDLQNDPAYDVIPTPEEQLKQDVLSNQDITTPASSAEDDDKSSYVVSSFEELLELDFHNPDILTEDENHNGQYSLVSFGKTDDNQEDSEEQLKRDVLPNQDVNYTACSAKEIDICTNDKYMRITTTPNQKKLGQYGKCK